MKDDNGIDISWCSGASQYCCSTNGEEGADMSGQSRGQAFWYALPFIGFIASEWQLWREEQTKPCYGLASMPEGVSTLSPYPLDMWPLLALPHGTLDEA